MRLKAIYLGNFQIIDFCIDFLFQLLHALYGFAFENKRSGLLISSVQHISLIRTKLNQILLITKIVLFQFVLCSFKSSFR